MKLKKVTMAGSKKVQAVLKRLSWIPFLKRFRRDGESATDANGGDGADAGAAAGAGGGDAAGGNNSNNNNNTKPRPRPGSGRKSKNKKSFSEKDKDSGQHALVYRCGLTVRQVFSVKQSWKAIMRDEESFGVEMFIRLFRTNASLQALFQGFKHIRSDDELRSNEALEYHATLVMTTLDDAITHIDNYEFVRQLLTKTGASHTKFSGFKPENFLQIKEPFLEAVRVTLGDRYTENMKTIYTIAITFILQTMVDGIEEAMAAGGVNGGAGSRGTTVS